jgi:hypothetical protein
MQLILSLFFVFNAHAADDVFFGRIASCEDPTSTSPETAKYLEALHSTLPAIRLAESQPRNENLDKAIRLLEQLRELSDKVTLAKKANCLEQISDVKRTFEHVRSVPDTPPPGGFREE